MQASRAAFPLDEKAVADTTICKHLQQLVITEQCAAVHTFLPMGSEIDLLPFILYLLANGIRVISPKVLPGRQLQHLELRSLEDVEPGIFGTRHPASGMVYTGPFDLIVVPGLAFDHQGNRLGYGQGFYDIFLSAHPEALKVGVAYDFQLVDALPVESHDVPLNGLITAGGFLAAGP